MTSVQVSTSLWIVSLSGHVIHCNIIDILHTAPVLSVIIAASRQPDEGQSYSLTCDVGGDMTLAVTSQTFLWTEVRSSTMLAQESILTFDPLLYANEGEYRCTSTITSPYLIETRTVTATAMITVIRKW